MPHATENTEPAGQAGLSGLLTADQSQLLDLINQLRNLGVNKMVDLPQIVVVGDQSSGKSSVLEAISRLSFPQSDGICTTFATELTLLREDVKTPSIGIRAAPSDGNGTFTSKDIKDRLEGFRCSDISFDNFESMVLQAKDHLIQVRGKKVDSFLEDTLVIKNSDPNFPPLTLVDLPGLIQSPNENQEQADKETVQKIVTSHMKNPKTIILAVVSAQQDPANQIVLSLAKKFDPEGKRTLGIITKPDLLDRGSKSEDEYLRTARNEILNNRFDLGWHVVRNRNFAERGTTLDERDEAERVWFENSVWANTIGIENVGIQALRDRLAVLLEKHTRRFLPEVMANIRDQLDKCNSNLAKLGPSRETPDQQRQYLTSISEHFKRLVELANEGAYRGDSFFSADANGSRRLRAEVQRLNKEFANVMTHRGHSIQSSNLSIFDFGGLPEQYKSASLAPKIVGHEKYLAKVRELLPLATAKEMEGMAGINVIQDVFKLKAENWQLIAEIHLEEVWKMTKDTLVAMMNHVTNDQTAQRVIRNIIGEDLEDKKSDMRKKLEELMAPHRRCHPITYNSSLGERKRILREKQQDSSETSESNTLFQVEAYYQITLENFIDNVAILVVEMCLIDGLSNIFTPSLVSRMSDEQLNSLAGESHTLRSQRHQLMNKQSKLENAHRQCLRNVEVGSQTMDAAPVPNTPIITPPEQDQVHSSISGQATPESTSGESLTATNVHITSPPPSPAPSARQAISTENTSLSGANSPITSGNPSSTPSSFPRASQNAPFGSPRSPLNSVPTPLSSPSGVFGQPSGTVLGRPLPTTGVIFGVPSPLGSTGGGISQLSSAPGGLFGESSSPSSSTSRSIGQQPSVSPFGQLSPAPGGLFGGSPSPASGTSPFGGSGGGGRGGASSQNTSSRSLFSFGQSTSQSGNSSPALDSIILPYHVETDGPGHFTHYENITTDEKYRDLSVEELRYMNMLETEEPYWGRGEKKPASKLFG